MIGNDARSDPGGYDDIAFPPIRREDENAVTLVYGIRCAYMPLAEEPASTSAVESLRPSANTISAIPFSIVRE